MKNELNRKNILFGGDYNPDQWDKATILRDIEIFHKARINTVSLPVFSWAKLEPREGEYDFAWLDRILDLLDEGQISYFLATPTSAQPAWLSRKYPEVLPVDIAGRKRTHGMRVFFCYNSIKFRERAAAIAGQMSERYKSRPGLIGWHVANEYGTYCYCDHCQQKFREWLIRRYGSLANLNDRWHTSFWGKTLYNIDEVMLPSELNDDYRFNPAVQLDYMRFVTDSTIECYLNEADILKAATPHLPVFTNISGFIKKLDQSKMVPCMDTAGWDNYPWPTDERSFPALKHDIMRGLKNGESYYVMEQSPNQQNWQPYNKLKKPGEVRRIAYQGLAHGSDSSMYFQMRQSVAGQEKFHGALISHSGRDDTRVIREMTRIGNELANLKDTFISARSKNRVGIYFDWESWWALELCSGPTKDMDYLKEVHHYYKPFYYRNIGVDIVMREADLSCYDVLVLPMLYIVKPELADRIKAFVAGGGILIGTYMTGCADENDRCIYGAYPGLLRDVFGIRVEETDALFPNEKSRFTYTNGKQYTCEFLCDLIHAEKAEVKAEYMDDFYRGMPVVTANTYGKGKAYYISSRVEQDFLGQLYEEIFREKEIKPDFETVGEIELTKRTKADADTWFVINHAGTDGSIDLGKMAYVDLISQRVLSGHIQVPGNEVMVLQRKV